MKLLSLTLIGFASADLGDIVKSKQDANEVFRVKRGIFDSDTWCKNNLKAPECWSEFTENVWQPLRPNNAVSRKEVRGLYWCVKKCTVKNFFLDFAGQSYEEKREKREEFLEVQPDAAKRFVTGCPKCCKKIPSQFHDLHKVQRACFGADEGKDPRVTPGDVTTQAATTTAIPTTTAGNDYDATTTGGDQTTNSWK